MPNDLMRNFKGDLRASAPLHSLEKALIWIAALNVCSLPWMLGGMRVWAQFITLEFGVLAFVISLIPRHYRAELTHGPEFTVHPWRKLIRWPIFWIGLVFFVYVLIQALTGLGLLKPRQLLVHDASRPHRVATFRHDHAIRDHEYLATNDDLGSPLPPPLFPLDRHHPPQKHHYPTHRPRRQRHPARHRRHRRPLHRTGQSAMVGERN